MEFNSINENGSLFYPLYYTAKDLEDIDDNIYQNSPNSTLNIDIQLNQGNSLLADQFLTGQGKGGIGASPTPYAIQQLAQGNSLFGFGEGNIQNSSGISLYLQSLKNDISQITPADL